MAAPFRYDPAHTALVIIDVQNDFCSPDGSLAALGADTSSVAQMMPRLHRLIDAARASGIPVVYVRTFHDATNDTPPWLGRVGEGPGSERTSLTCRTGSWGAEFYEVRPAEDDHVVTKYRFSAFVGTRLHLLLQALDVRSVLFAGVTTEVCVESSLRDALFHEYYVSMVADCCASYDSQAHETSQRVVAHNFGTVVNADDLQAAWAAA